MKLAEVGEFGLIDRIHRIIGGGCEGITVGMGDDAAVFRTRPGWLTVITTDSLVEGVHFNRQYTPVESLGWKTLAINISDITAMGGVPRYGVVSLALPENWTVEDVDSLYRGMVRCGEVYGCTLVGGDTVRSCSGCFISATVVGEVEEDCFVKRSGAQEGDLLCMTGEVGGSRVGLEVLTSGKDRNQFPHSVGRFLEPKVRLQEARWLVKTLGVSSMIDISDGLSSEINHICRQSRLGCVVWEEKIPVAEEAVLWANIRGEKISAYKLESGEEYELVFTVDRDRYDKWRAHAKDRSDVSVTAIGEMTRKEKGIRVNRDGEVLPLTPIGWDHFDE